MLMETRKVFPSLFLRRVRFCIWACIVCAMLVLSTFTATSIYESDRTRKLTLQEIYTGPARKVEENKMRAAGELGPLSLSPEKGRRK